MARAHGTRRRRRAADGVPAPQAADRAAAGAWDDASDWTPAWIGFGAAWHEFGPEGNARPSGPLPWAAHQRLWSALAEFDSSVRYRRRLNGIPTEPTAEWPGLNLR